MAIHNDTMAPKLSMVLSQPIDKIVEDQGPSLSFVIVFKIWKAYLQQTQNQMTQQSPNWRPNNVPNHPVNLIEMPPPPCPPPPTQKQRAKSNCLPHYKIEKYPATGPGLLPCSCFEPDKIKSNHIQTQSWEVYKRHSVSLSTNPSVITRVSIEKCEINGILATYL